MDSEWFVYILRCSDDSLYTGVTNDVPRRLNEHNHATHGAKYTKARRPVTLVYAEEAMDRASAQRREHELKSLTRLQKLRLIATADTASIKALNEVPE